MQTTYLGLVRDHSGSMRSIAHAASKDYNSKIAAIQDAAFNLQQDTIVSVVECGYDNTDRVRRAVVNTSVTALQPMDGYIANGTGTPLWDSVGELIELFESSPVINNKDVSFLVMAITDGHENCSVKYNARSLSQKIQQLQATDRWTFVFRVPRRHGASIISQLGISEYNIQEWDQTVAGVEKAAKRDAEAFTQYLTSRSMGATSTTKFYANLDEGQMQKAKADLVDISAEVTMWPVKPTENNVLIRDFVEGRLSIMKGGRPATMLKGAAFYQLKKTEPIVQDHKKIIIRDRTTNALYGGVAARQVLGLPAVGNCRLAPGSHTNYDIYIQSTSVNRKLASGTFVIYWPAQGTAFKEGPSAK